MGAFGYGGFKGAQRGETPRFLDAEIAQTNAENQAQMQENQARSSNLTGAATLGMEGYKAGMFGGAPATGTAAPISTAVPAGASGAAPLATALTSTAVPVVGGGGAGGALAAGTGGASLGAGAAGGGSGALASMMASPLAPFAAALLVSQLF